jgi:hypothetical protein
MYIQGYKKMKNSLKSAQLDMFAVAGVEVPFSMISESAIMPAVIEYDAGTDADPNQIDLLQR